MDDQITQPTAEELAAEQQQVQLPKEEDIRAEIIEEYGFDADADAERIDKLTKKEMKAREDLSTAIRQKIKHRTAALAAVKPGDKKPEEAAPASTDTLTPRDALTLTNAGIKDEEDIDEVIAFAAYRKLPISKALEDSTLKGILAAKAEERRTAEAAASGKNGRGAARPTGADILAKAEQTGEVPEDTEGMQDLFNARVDRRVNRNKR